MSAIRTSASYQNSNGPVAQICRTLRLPMDRLEGSYYPGEVDPFYHLDEFSEVMLEFYQLENEPEGHLHVSDRRAACYREFEGFPEYLRDNRTQPSPEIRDPRNPEHPLDIHDRNYAAKTSWPGLEAEAVLPIWLATNIPQLRRSRVAYCSHLAGAPSRMFYNPCTETIPVYRTESVSLILTLHGNPFIMNPPPEAEAKLDGQQLIAEARASHLPDICETPSEGQRLKIRDCTMWGMLHSCLVFPCSKAMMCCICKACFNTERSKASRNKVKCGKLFSCEDFSWYNGLRAFAKHATNPAAHHMDEVYIEGIASENRYNNLYPIVTIQDEALRGLTMAQLMNTVAREDFPGSFGEVVQRLRKFVLDRESLAIGELDDYSRSSSPLGPVGGFLQDKIGRVVFWQANARLEYMPGFDAARPYVVWQNTCPLDPELDAALARRLVELEPGHGFQAHPSPAESSLYGLQRADWDDPGRWRAPSSPVGDSRYTTGSEGWIRGMTFSLAPKY
ncbi:hypothetical protein Pmar_PMAR005092 [Perkinsus marinus ATCC 50983]|uniref:Uncharacterized protein n=1 Tax=Perkinsus marinus (strain ATCC 50983 / TXsc) TaxID=423536 RepID=C5KAL1_PERM5|nr:hypothetical protein Pmar_PMAR005092 [Perkinsus marinus ATCC 50983]EER18187.1 hypothetical protein Pmar_PMAR005092 [Perkinsus marinus ATCC 50983]|eukprot:XP_002786391.1 hypothetical protein Pmar_PMAR005092 [Perkinsus marinus ATCC 50983]